MFIDVETGTVVNGPIIFVDDNVFDPADDFSDAETIAFAQDFGSHVIYQVSPGDWSFRDMRTE